ncbi:molybdopterin-synthase adenylyltransferase MoeB [Aquisalimonas asiatica]|uniref:Molybdopterin-synthase adenylyltransferase n=1 Tax=Aquisalimonas asiatica TaxID=406100 RepID=A0A1H8RKZ6_9GAMM|nr:molybdopterin-synthase adenylyltransferase MoeB [Aquisalimonas asiatica]SEO67080.1 Molybdopterin or thiamine biosynthesis adenylyltransferase [Aquisalimonas asiatica]
MPVVTVRIPTPLRGHVEGRPEVTLEGQTVGDVLNRLATDYPALGQRLLTPEGRVRTYVNVFVGEHNMTALDGWQTPVSEGQVVSVLPAVAGGAGRARDRRLERLRESVDELEPRQAHTMLAGGAALIDVREPDEVAEGSPDGALRLGRGYLELRVEDEIPDLDRPVMVMCGGGTRSLFAAEDLQRLGYTRVYSVAGGFNQWKNEGLPFSIPRMLDADARARYSRHLLMPEVGEAGQARLLDSKVLLVGAGGLGSPAALYLAAAGVGTIGIVDHDVVDRSNLQRQVIHSEERVGLSKVESAREAIRHLNSSVTVVGHEAHLESGNVEDLFSGYDVIVDGTDNFPSRYLINDACVKLGLPNVHGAVYRFEGQVTVFWPGRPDAPGPCYRCLFPEPPPPELAPSCAEAGVLGVLPGVVGLMQSVETIKLLLGIGEPLVGRLLHYDALAARFHELRVERDTGCAYCGDGVQFPGYVDYQAFCTGS